MIDLVKAHRRRDDDSFDDLVVQLADEEERKGNSAVATALRGTYPPAAIRRTHPGGSTAEFALSGAATLPAPPARADVASLFSIERPQTTLDDLVLPDEQRSLLRRFVAEIRGATELRRYGLTPATRMLICGPPGCGKTRAAWALSAEMGRDLVHVHLDALVSSYLGQTSLNIRRVFESQRNRPVAIFLDEFDAIAKTRDDAHELGELKRVVTALLQLVDDLDPATVLLAATNHEQLLDTAIWRRFDWVVRMDLPDTPQRQRLVEHFLQRFGLDELDTERLARIFAGATPADIEATILESVREAVSARGEPALQSIDVEMTFIRRATLHAPRSSHAFIQAVEQLNRRGVPLRALATALEIPHTTLADRVRRAQQHPS